jgi:glycosyltransferase involved in cell wall biosynthesis
VIQDKKTGLLANERKVEELADYLIKMYHNPDLRKKLGQAGAKHIREHFSAKKQGKGLSQIYQRCMES